MTDAERMACIEAWSSGSWGDRLGEIVRICIAVEKAVSRPTAPTTQEPVATHDVGSGGYSVLDCPHCLRTIHIKTAHPPAPTTQEPVAWAIWAVSPEGAASFVSARTRKSNMAAFGHYDSALYAHPPTPTTQEPVAWQYRWTNPGNRALQPDEMLEWKSIEHPNWQTLQQEIADLEAYRYDGKPCYEVRKLFAHPPTPTRINVRCETEDSVGSTYLTPFAVDIEDDGSTTVCVKAWPNQSAPTTQEPVAWRLLTKQWPTIQDEDYRYIPYVHGMTQNDGWLPLYASPPAPTTPQSASVFGGSYQADGYIISRFTTTAGAERVLFEFKEPKGMLHIFTPEEIKVKP